MTLTSACRPWFMVSLLGFLDGGCAHTLGTDQVGRLSSRVAELSRLYREEQARREELENRVLILSDQLESQQVAYSRRGIVELPVITLTPQGPSVSAPQSQPQQTRARPDRVDVEFSGAARSEAPDRIRPLLRAQGDSYVEYTPSVEPEEAERSLAAAPVRTSGRSPQGIAPRRARPALAPMPPSGDNLGVVPLPRFPAQAAAALPAAAAHAAPAPVLPQKVGPEEAEPLGLYRIAYDHLRAGRFDQAERDLREFVRRFPRHDYADNAQYWLGETYYARKTYAEAVSAFRAVVERWPSGNKAPDALLKLGFSLLMMGQTQKGRDVLAQLLTHYPNTNAARLADRRLSEVSSTKDHL